MSDHQDAGSREIGIPTTLDTSNVVDPQQILKSERQQIEGLLAEISGNIATLSVQLARTKVIRDALVAGIVYADAYVPMPVAPGQ